MSHSLTNKLICQLLSKVIDIINKRRYYVIVYVGYLWPPDFGLISVRSLLYTQKSLLLLRNISSFWYCWCYSSVALEIMRAVWKWRGGGGYTGVEKSFVDVHARLLWRAIYSAKPRPDAGSQSGSRSSRGLGGWFPRIILSKTLWPQFWSDR